MVILTTPGIALSSTPVAVNHATADVGIFLMIGALRQAYVPLAAIRTGNSSYCPLLSTQDVTKYRQLARTDYTGPRPAG